MPECSKSKSCASGKVCIDGICLDKGMSPAAGKVIFNEVLADASVDGDPNGDGSSHKMEDEFVELVNVSNATVDVSGWKLVESDWDVWVPRYTFPAGTKLAPKKAAVLFGGGDAPGSTAAVFFAVSNAADAGTAYGLDLDDGGDKVRLLDAKDGVVAVFAYGKQGGVPAVSDQSLTRDPDLSGKFVGHSLAKGAKGAVFSPGTSVGGVGF